MRGNGHLAALLGLIALTALVVVSHPTGPVTSSEVVPIVTLPSEVAGWRGVDGVPVNVLPIDPRSIGGQRRTYMRNGQSVWLAVGRYGLGNDPQHRPLPDHIVAIPGNNALVHEETRLAVNGVSGQAMQTVTMNVVALRRGERPLLVGYWYQLGDDPVTGEYALRLRRFSDALLGRQRPLTLVRIAAAERATLEAFLQAFHPHLVQTIVQKRG
jgi:EpsI family protein